MSSSELNEMVAWDQCLQWDWSPCIDQSLPESLLLMVNLEWQVLRKSWLRMWSSPSVDGSQSLCYISRSCFHLGFISWELLAFSPIIIDFPVRTSLCFPLKTVTSLFGGHFYTGFYSNSLSGPPCSPLSGSAAGAALASSSLYALLDPIYPDCTHLHLETWYYPCIYIVSLIDA